MKLPDIRSVWEGYRSEYILFREFLGQLTDFLRGKLKRWFWGFEAGKSFLVDGIYRQRGKYAGIFIHLSVVFLGFFALTLGPSLVSGARDKTQFGASVINLGIGGEGGQILGANVDATPVTVMSDKPRAEVEEYEVKDGDTLSTIAGKFGVSVDSIKWLNDKITSEKSIKPGQKIMIPPVTGVIHKVKSGETIYSVAKKYSAEAQAIVDFPFNTFTNDETFSLAIGQVLVVPDGTMPDPQVIPTSVASRLTRDAGAVSATGKWIWPAAGIITQPYYPWHKAIDIANGSGGPILAADAGKVIVAGWPDNSGYGNRVMIDHQNGFVTLYAHMSRFSVVVGQTVKRGDVLGQMGSTGRSTGTHLHFEIRAGGHGQNPLNFLK